MSDMISAMSQPAETTENYVDHRLRTIAINAVREARIAYGRDNGQWIDDDSRRAELIFHYLHITPIEQINVSAESYPLVATLQSAPDKSLDEAERVVRRRRSRKDDAVRMQAQGAIESALSNLAE